MKRKEIIERLCALCTDVGDYFEEKFPHDCFCHRNSTPSNDFQFSHKIIEFIEDIVRLEMGIIKCGICGDILNIEDAYTDIECGDVCRNCFMKNESE
jgi:hypothetical protein